MPEVYKFANKHGLRVIEDAAHSFGSFREAEMIGSFGDIICFSFDGIKNITCGEGGAILSSDQNVINQVKDARLLGVMKDSVKRYQGKRSWKFDVEKQGWRYHMSNINAAIGLAQIRNSEVKFQRKREIAATYIKCFENIEGIKTLEIFSKGTVNHIFPILVSFKIRDKIRELLLADKIETGLHYQPNHSLKFFKSDYELPVAEELSKRVISLPFHSLLTDEEQTYVISRLIYHLRNLMDLD